MFGAWYWIGVAAGFGVALGVVVAGVLGVRSTLLAAAVAAAAGALAGFALVGFDSADWGEPLAGAIGGAVAAVGAAPLVGGALARGGTRGGTAALLAVGALVLAALALVPAVGYVELAAIPALGARLRRVAGRRHGGLRILARD
jgi:hypothetical protein